MSTRRASQPLVYAIGLDPLAARAIAADLPQARIRRPRPLVAGEARRHGPAPDLVVLDLTATDAAAERAAAWRTWGERTLIVGLDRDHPTARVWHTPTATESVEIGPGFIAPFLPLPATGRADRRLVERLPRPAAVLKRSRFVAYAASACFIAAVDRDLAVLLVCSLAMLTPSLTLYRRARLAR